MNQEVLFLLGMHRSGTSLLARLIAAEGYELPSDLFPPHAADNPDGYQESRSVVRINNAFLEAVGSHWKDPCPLPRNCFRSPAADAAHAAIREFLAANGRGRLLLKDPRLCRLLPLWLEVLQERQVRLLHLIREPSAVRASLLRRSEVEDIKKAGIGSANHSGVLWWRHVSEALEHSESVASLTVSYESLIADPLRVRGEILDFLGLPRTANPPAEWMKIRSWQSRPPEVTESSCGRDAMLFLQQGYETACADPGNFGRPLRDVPSPLDQRHPWPSETYDCVSAAMLKHLSGSIPHARPVKAVIASTQGPARMKRARDIAFITDKPEWPCQIYRVKNPVDALCRSGSDCRWFSIGEIAPSLAELQDFRCVILHRVEWGREFLSILDFCRRRNIPVGYDLDDLIFDAQLVRAGARDALNRKGEASIREWIVRADNYARCIAESDFFIGATVPLTQAAQSLNSHCFMIPNAFAPENLCMSDLARSNKNSTSSSSSERVVLGYASGTATHVADFGVISKLLWELMSQDPRIVLRVIGPLECDDPPPQSLADRIERRALVPHTNLPFELASFDVNLAPLERNPFCDAKSPLKFFEAGLVSVPTVATRNPVYSEIHYGDCGLLLASSQRDWADHLRRLISSAELRAAQGAAARRASVARFHVDVVVKGYLDLPMRR